VKDDWKGEELIRKKPSRAQKDAENRRIVTSVYHDNRRKAGIPVPGKKPFFDFGLLKR
jgi:hypothetical protein